MDLLELRFLGSFQATLDGQPIVSFESSKVRALLAYLAVEARQPHPRERLAGLLWPDWPQKSAMSNLRSALADLRKNLRDRQAQTPFLLVSREDIQFNQDSNYSLDVNEFDRIEGYQQSSILDIKTAIELYRGEFLDGFSVGDSAVFEQWVVVMREHYHQRMLKDLQDLAEFHEQKGEYGEALVYIRQLLTLEPWQEEAHQQLMRLLVWNGQRSAALAQYDICRQQLEVELQVEPEKETVVLYESIRDGTLVAPRPRVVSRPLGEPENQVELLSRVVPPAPRHNLPRRLSRFIGREKEIAQVKALVVDSPLVTLTGPGGVGKTRLALAVAETLRELYIQGVWFVNLAPVVDPQLLEHTLANVLGVREEAGQALLDQLAFYFRDRQVLLILDNCEHLVDACARLANALLTIAPHLKIMASSREALGVEGEVTWRVPSLSIPPTVEKPSFDNLLNYESTRLFLDRVRAVLPEFHITPQNAPAVAQVCQRLDGIPLAIELAAARLASLEVEQIASRLDNAFRLLAGGSRVALERHRTLRATIDWSYNLLPDAERLLLLRLSVFSGGCTLEAAEAVCSDDGIAQEEVLDLLTQLVNKSMLQVDRRPGKELRYRLLETIRQYAVEKLFESGESERLRTRHLDHYLSFAEEIDTWLGGRDLVMRLDRLENELDNFRSALEWGLQTDVLAELQLASSLNNLWYIRDHISEGISLLEQGLSITALTQGTHAPGRVSDVTTDQDTIRAKALSVEGYLKSIIFLIIPAMTLLKESLAFYKKTYPNNLMGNAFALFGLAGCAQYRGDIAQGYALADQSRILFQELGNQSLVGFCLEVMGMCAPNLEHAEELFIEELTIENETGDLFGIASALWNLGYLALGEGSYEKAAARFSESLDRYRELGHQTGVALDLDYLGLTASWRGDYQLAARYFEWAYAQFQDIGHYTGGIQSLIHHSFLALAQGNYTETLQIMERAVSIAQESVTGIPLVHLIQGIINWINGENDQATTQLEEAIAIAHEINYHGLIWKAQYYLGRIALSNGDAHLASSHFKECLRSLLNTLERHFIAHPMEALASLAFHQGNMERAARLYGIASKWGPGLVNTRSPAERTWCEKASTTVRASLGESQFTEKWTEGRNMPREKAIAYALEEESD